MGVYVCCVEKIIVRETIYAGYVSGVNGRFSVDKNVVITSLEQIRLFRIGIDISCSLSSALSPSSSQAILLPRPTS